MAEKMSKIQRRQKALLEAIAYQDRGIMISDLVADMVHQVPYIAWQRSYIASLIEENNNLQLLILLLDVIEENNNLQLLILLLDDLSQLLQS